MNDPTNDPAEQAWWRRVEGEFGLPEADDVRPDVTVQQ